MAKGYISIHRKIWDTTIWKEKEPFDMRSAWIDLILMANHADNNVMVNKKVVEIKTGQTLTSYGKLSERWHWSVGKVRRYLDLLKRLEMITLNGTQGGTLNGTLITVVNYGVYQGKRHTVGITVDTTVDTADGITDGITGGTQTIMSNKVINNERIKMNKGQTADDINALFAKMRKEGKI